MTTNSQLQQALTHLQQNQIDACQELCRTIIQKTPNNADAYHLMALGYCQKKQYDTAFQYFQTAIKNQPNEANFYYNFANCLKQANHTKEAINTYQQAANLAPNNEQIWFNLATTYNTKNELEQCQQCYLKAIEIKPDYIKAYYNLAQSYLDQDNAQQAQYFFQKALSYQPGYAKALSGMALCEKHHEHFDHAIHYFKQALRHENLAEFHYNLGNTYHQTKQFDLAISHYQQALKINGKYDLAYYALGSTYLLLGNYQAGWNFYEYRWRSEKNPQRHHHITRWDGQELTNKNILIWGEQGIGDTLQFSQTLPLIIQQCKQCIVECDERLIPLLQRSFPEIKAIAYQTDNNFQTRVDFQCPIISLAQWTSPALPFLSPQISFIKPNQMMVESIKKRYQQFGSLLKIGISWKSGNPDFGALRSCHLSHWVKLLKTSNCIFINLQYGNTHDDLNELSTAHDINVFHDQEVDPLDNLDQFAAQLCNLDLVISIDNSTVHFAAALGIPVWTLLPYIPDWRWQLNSDTTPWYPTMRLFRQTKRGDWESVFQQIDRIDYYA
ncbi:MAG: tetratricopeptide repeat protein [Methylococcales bacterium]|nr:tetratricopeptide repeat protein [Methylococcales bacterium]MBT7408702.1 tetratricopeptide repeat protein [Methylococcales bacterium]